MGILVCALLAVAPTPTPSPSASPSPTPPPTIATTVSRSSNLVGKTFAASTGTIGQEQIATRPILRPGEVLEAIPGLVISQHSGGGKANQYYLRGFQLDHGTDLEATIAGIPINLPSHAHGQGYSDINWLIPELVSAVEFKKGPYYAEQGDFSTAGAYQVFYKNTVAPTAAVEGGGYGYRRILIQTSTQRPVGSNLLYAFEALHDDGSLDHPDDYRKVNGVVRWSKMDPNTQMNLTAWGYSGIFNSSDQIPQRLVDAGVLDRYGLVDTSDGGRTSRFALSGEYMHTTAHGQLQASIYGFEQYLDLFSNFTYFFDDATDYYNVHSNPLTCTSAFSRCQASPQHVSTYTSYCPSNTTNSPFAFACGDQREQQDRRFVSGFTIAQAFDSQNRTTTFGAGVRNDNVSTVGLFLTNDRVRYANGTLSNDKVLETNYNAFVKSSMRWNKLRVEPAIRVDFYRFHVSADHSANSGSTTASLVSPKLDAAYAFSPSQEVYIDAGESFHSNDARGIFLTRDPQTHATVDAGGNPIAPVTPLVRAKGEEFGYRYSSAKLTTTVSVWQLDLASELVFDGDHGVTNAGGPTRRYGLELANFYRPTPGLTFDADISTSSARFTESALQDGTHVPESLNEVIAAGVTVDKPSYSASLRARYFGPRTLDTQGDALSLPSLIFNGQYTAHLNPHLSLRLDALNIFNANADDVEYYYASWLPSDGATYGSSSSVNPALGGSGINDYHLHPSQRRTVRFSILFKP